MQRRVSKFPVLYRKFGKNGIHLLGGLQDNRSAIYSVDNQWRVTNLGDGTYNAFDPVQDSLLYCSSQYQNLYRSTNFGNQWEELIPPNQEAGFVSPFILCKSNPNRIYSGGNMLLRSDNRGTSWDTTFLSNKNEKSQLLSTIQIAPMRYFLQQS